MRSGWLMSCGWLLMGIVFGPLAAEGAPPVQEKPEAKTADIEPGFESLFNGRDLAGWIVMKGGRFSVRDGVIVLDRGGGWLRSSRTYQNFELRMEFRFLDPGANSGVFVRAIADDGPSQAYQVQTMDGDSLGDLYTRSLPKPKVQHQVNVSRAQRKPVGEWQSYAIRLQGQHLEVRLNGVLITAADGLADQAGYLGPQGEGGRLEFRRIRLQELPAAN